MATNKFNDIILDVDGTIWNTTEVVAFAWNKVIERSGFAANKVTAQQLQKEFGKTMSEIASDLWANLNTEQQSFMMSNCCKEEQVALKELDTNLCYPFVVEEIKELSRSVDFYIVSNCQKGYIELVLEKTGLKPFVKDWECFGNTGKGKAENITLLIERNKLKSPIYVGDTQGDADACIKAKVPFVWASYGFGSVKNYFAKIESFVQLKSIVL